MNLRILVVDDSKAMRALIRRTLLDSGFGDAIIEEAGGGHEALVAIRRSPPDLVLANWHMPKMSGIDLLEALQRDGTAVPCGFITSDNSETCRTRAMAAGARFLISKPLAPASLHHAIDDTRGHSAPVPAEDEATPDTQRKTI